MQDGEIILGLTQMQAYAQELLDWAVRAVPRFLLAVFALVAGLWLAKRVGDGARAALERSGVAREFVSFFSSIIRGRQQSSHSRTIFASSPTTSTVTQRAFLISHGAKRNMTISSPGAARTRFAWASSSDAIRQ